MREVAFVTKPQDFGAMSALVVGLPMLQWTFGAHGLMQRLRPPLISMEQWSTDIDQRNRSLIDSIKKPDDDQLAEISFQKSLDEVKAGVLCGPFEQLSDIPAPACAVAPRRGIWECHGDAIVPSVRNIDDLLAGEQNLTCGTTYAHRPTDVDGLVAQARCAAETFSLDALAGWTSDFSKAFKQIPGDPTEYGSIVLVQWSPKRMRPVFFVTYSQVFGSKNAPVNFSRYPAWSCEVMAAAFAVPAPHCVDDVISIERLCTASSGRMAWLEFAGMCGWKVAMDKSPPPAQLFRVIGVSINLGPHPKSGPTVMITKRRL